MTAKTMHNPYWEEAEAFVVSASEDQWCTYKATSWSARDSLVRRYSWAVPDPEALCFVASSLGPRAIEIGAGTGYWASLREQAGVDILAFDAAPPDRLVNDYHRPRNLDGTFREELVETWYQVAPGIPETCASYPDRSLFLCWPPMSYMAKDCLSHYRGNRLVYIGEDKGGCTANDAFFAALREHWEISEEYALAQWFGCHDEIIVYERRNP